MADVGGIERRTLTRIGAASSVVRVIALGVLALLGLGEATAWAQAEPAPAGYEPPTGVPISVDPRRRADEREARLHRWTLEAHPRLVIALGRGSGATNQGDGLPLVGWGAGVGLSGAMAVFGRSRLSLGVSFAYERRQHTDVPPPGLENGDTVQWVSQASFSLDLKLDALFYEGVLRPWISLGPAMSVASYSQPPSTDDPKGLSATSVLPGLRAAVGVAGLVTSNIELGGRLEWLATFGGDALGKNGIRPLTPGNFAVGIDFAFRF